MGPDPPPSGSRESSCMPPRPRSRAGHVPPTHPWSHSSPHPQHSLATPAQVSQCPLPFSPSGLAGDLAHLLRPGGPAPSLPGAQLCLARLPRKKRLARVLERRSPALSPAGAGGSCLFSSGARKRATDQTRGQAGAAARSQARLTLAPSGTAGHWIRAPTPAWVCQATTTEHSHLHCANPLPSQHPPSSSSPGWAQPHLPPVLPGTSFSCPACQTLLPSSLHP